MQTSETTTYGSREDIDWKIFIHCVRQILQIDFCPVFLAKYLLIVAGQCCQRTYNSTLETF